MRRPAGPNGARAARSTCRRSSGQGAEVRPVRGPSNSFPFRWTTGLGLPVLRRRDPGPNGATSRGERGRRALLIGGKRTRRDASWTPSGGWASALTCCRRISSPCTTSSPTSIFAAPGEPPSAKPCPVAAALDVGCDVTNIVVSSPQSLWFHSCGVAGQSFTRALVKEFNLSIAQAEQLKRAPESAERLSDLYEALSPVFDDLLKEAQESLAAYAETDPIARWAGCGRRWWVFAARPASLSAVRTVGSEILRRGLACQAADPKAGAELSAGGWGRSWSCATRPPLPSTCESNTALSKMFRTTLTKRMGKFTACFPPPRWSMR